MPFLISSPSTTSDGDIKQKVLGTIQFKETTLVAATATDILEADETATNGRKILNISNIGTEPVYINYGTTATTANYDFILYANCQLLDIEYNMEKISAIANGAATIRVKYAKYIEV
jgi:hypothetical protein